MKKTPKSYYKINKCRTEFNANSYKISAKEFSQSESQFIMTLELNGNEKLRRDLCGDFIMRSMF